VVEMDKKYEKGVKEILEETLKQLGEQFYIQLKEVKTTREKLRETVDALYELREQARLENNKEGVDLTERLINAYEEIQKAIDDEIKRIEELRGGVVKLRT
jgi:hypothetical protein